jgi:hypothetical protein
MGGMRDQSLGAVPCRCGGNCGQCGGAGDWIDDGKDKAMSTDMGYEAPDKVPVAPDIIAARRKRKLTHGIILSGWILTILTMVAIIGTALYMMTAQGFAKLPEELAQWCGIALGFLFGSFTGIVKDFISDAPE